MSDAAGKQAGHRAGGIEEIRHGETVLAIILPSTFEAPGTTFLTPNDYSQQLGYMHHPRGKVIEPHCHNHVPREVTYTQEVLFIRRGRLRVDLYSPDRKYLESRMLSAGDIILLASGGHGFEVIEEVEMVEVKQGPYMGDSDKTRFQHRPEAIVFPGTGKATAK